MMKQWLIIASIVLVFPATAQQLKLMLPVGHTKDINTAVFSPDNKKLLTASDDQTAKIWDVQTGYLLTNLEGHTEKISTANFDATGKHVVTASHDGTAGIWDATTGELLFLLKGHTGAINNAQFSGNGLFIITSSYDSSVKVWDAINGSLAMDFGKHTGQFIVVSVSPDGKKVATRCEKTFALWDISFKKKIATYSSEYHFNDFPSTAFSPDSKTILVPAPDNVVNVINTTTGEIMKSLKGHKGQVVRAEYVDSNVIITKSFDSTIKLWRAGDWKEIANLTGHRTWAMQYRLSTDKNKIITSSGNEIHIWNIADGRKLLTTKQYTSSRFAPAFSPSGKHILVPGYSTVEFIDAVTGKPVARAVHEKDWSGINKVIVSNDGKRLLTVLGNSMLLWDTESGRYILNLDGHTENVTKLSVSPDKKDLLIITPSNRAKVVDAQTGELKFSLQFSGISYVRFGEYSADGKKILVGNESIARVFDAATGKEISYFFSPTIRLKPAVVTDKKVSPPKTRSSNFITASFSADGKKIVTIGSDRLVRIWDSETGQHINMLVTDVVNKTTHDSRITCAVFSPDAKQVITTAEDFSVYVWNVETATGGRFINYDTIVRQISLSSDKKHMLITSDDNFLDVFDFKLSQREFKINVPGGVRYANFSEEDKNIVYLDKNGTIRTVAFNTSIVVDSFAIDPLQTVFYIDPVQRYIVSSYNSEVRVGKITGKDERPLMVLIDSADHFVQLPSKYYLSSPNAAKRLYYLTPEKQVIGFDQLDIRYNRPDKVLAGVGSSDTSRINAYRKAFLKRVKKLGIDTTRFSDTTVLPFASIVNREKIGYELSDGKLTLQIHASDSSTILDRLNIWVNEVPVFGIEGFNLRYKRSFLFDTTIILTLSSGDNRIEAAVTNATGIESYRTPMFVRYTEPVAKIAKVHFIGIGIDHFAEPGYDLRWSVQDIHDLSAKLQQKYPDMIVDTLYNKAVTRENILALKQKLQQLDEDDKVIISYSGHGLLSKELDYFLSTYHVSFSDPAINGLAYDELESLVDGIRPRQKLILIDACHSGEVDKEEIERIEAARKDLDSLGTTRDTTNRSSITVKTKVGMTNSFELMQNIFVNVSRGTGATIISAAGGMQYAQESGELKNGVFTYCIVDAFNKNKTLSVSHLKKIVGENVQRLTNGLQRPTSRNETNSYDWIVW